MQQIVVGVDGSSSAAAALQWALRESQLRSCPVNAVMIWDYLTQYHRDKSTEFDPAYDADAATNALEFYVREAVGECNVGRVAMTVACDVVTRGMLAAASTASLLVLGARGRNGFKELLLGSVSQRCLHKASCPVVIVRTPLRDDPCEHRRIVAGVDGSADGQAALRWAVQEASYRDAELRVVHAAEPSYFDLPLPGGVSATDVASREANAVLSSALGKLDVPSAVRIDLSPTSGSPAKALLRASDDADLLVIGRAGRGLVGGRLVGSVATQISHHAGVPTVFVNARDNR